MVLLGIVLYGAAGLTAMSPRVPMPPTVQAHALPQESAPSAEQSQAPSGENAPSADQSQAPSGENARSAEQTQAPPEEHPGLFEEIKSRLSGRSAEQIWDEASRMPSAMAAVPLMEALAKRTGEPEYSGRAALWLGHFYYGAGQIEDALTWFEQAEEQKGDKPTAEPAFWAAQCRNLLGRPNEAAAESAEQGTDGVLAAVAEHDGELRTGELAAALDGYLSLEGAARRAGCLGPLLYRIGLVASTAAGRNVGRRIDWDLVKGWEPGAAASPERGLVAAMAPGIDRERTATGESPSARSAEDSTRAATPRDTTGP